MTIIMYNWSIILYRSGSEEHEMLHFDDTENLFKTKSNAQLFAESWALDYIAKADGPYRLEPFNNMNSPLEIMSGLQISRSQIQNILEKEQIPTRHYLIGEVSGKWGLTVYKIQTKEISGVETYTEEVEIEEEKDVDVEKRVTIPGRLYNSYKMEKVREKVKTTRKEPVIKTRTQRKKVVISSDLFTLSLVKIPSSEKLLSENKTSMMKLANDLANNFSKTLSAKTIREECSGGRTYKISELIDTNRSEFGKYRPPIKKIRAPIPPPKEQKERLKSESVLKPAVQPRPTANVGAGLAGLAAEFIAKRNKMFPLID